MWRGKEVDHRIIRTAASACIKLTSEEPYVWLWPVSASMAMRRCCLTLAGGRGQRPPPFLLSGSSLSLCGTLRSLDSSPAEGLRSSQMHVPSPLHLLCPLTYSFSTPTHNLRTEVRQPASQAFFLSFFFFVALLYRTPDQSSLR